MPEADENNLHRRDQLLRDTFTLAENLVCWTLLITCAVAFVFADPRSFWTLGFYLIVGGICPILLKIHEHTHPFFIDMLWPRFWLLTSPVWLICLQFICGLLEQPIKSIEFDGQVLLTIEKGSVWLPASSAKSTTLITVLGFASIYLLALNLFFIPKSQAFFNKSLSLLCLGAVLIGIFGYLQKGMNMERPLFTTGTGQSDFFALFPYDGHWAAFAMIWCAVCVAMALLTTRDQGSDDFVNSIGPWYLTGAVILGASGFIIHAQLPGAALLLLLSVLMLIVAVNFLSESTDKHRKSIAICSGLFSVAAFVAGIFRIFQENTQAETMEALRKSAWDMFLDSPIFGWGFDSFPQIAPFYADDLLHGNRHDRATSDLLHYLAELGIVGSLLLPGLCIYLVARYLRSGKSVQLTNHILLGCLGVGILGLCDSPCMSPTVFLSFFIVLFSALRWADLSRTKVDEVDSRPQLVTPSAQRRVPFFTETYNDAER